MIIFIAIIGNIYNIKNVLQNQRKFKQLNCWCLPLCLTMRYINGRLIETFFILYILPVIAINIIICLGPNYKSECNSEQFK